MTYLLKRIISQTFKKQKKLNFKQIEHKMNHLIEKLLQLRIHKYKKLLRKVQNKYQIK